MSDDAPGPDTRRVVLALLCVLGLVAASTAAPALAGDTPLGGLDSPRAPSQVPEFLLEMDALNWLFGDAPPQTLKGAGSLFGALDPGDSTSVGGAIPESARALASQTHFVATAPERTYWRTGAYVRYTGSGWTGTETHRQHAPRKRPGDRETGRTTEYRVQLKRPATALPIVWRPVKIQPNCSSAENVCDTVIDRTSTWALRAPSGFSSGMTYTVVANKPPRSEAALTANADDDVRRNATPSGDDFVVQEQAVYQEQSVHDSYTEVSTTVRVRALSAQVTGDADTRYEKVKAVENYLEGSKTYSLSNGTASGENVVDEFLFEQDAGYCEHFASSMVVMLRTQDIPARYVVGYAGGKRVGENRYLVRGADAHAWVEVYFEDVGWVRFDPTPSAPRRAADERLRGPSAYRVGLNQTATPGEPITVTVTAGGSPVSGVAVTVNDEPVGATDGNGEVVFTVPYAEEIDVDLGGWNASATSGTGDGAVANSAEITGAMASGVVTGGAMASGVVASSVVANVPPPKSAQQATGQESTVAWRDGAPGDDDENGTSHTFPVSADVSFQFRDDVEPGTTVTLQAFVGNQRFPRASIRVAGERVGRTNERGVLDVTIPEDASGVIELTASRGGITQTETYPVDGLVVSVSPSLVAPMPWTEATARVTSGGEAVTDTVVELDGEVVGRTDENGNVRFEVPLARVPKVSASTDGKHAVTYVDGVLPTFVVVTLATLAALAGVVLSARRRGVTVDGAVALLARVVNEAAALAVRAVVGFADALEELAAEFRDATRNGWRGVLEWLASLPGRVRAPNVRAWVAAVLAAVREEGGGRTGATRTNQRGSGVGASGRLQSVWRRFVSLVGVERWETKTPGEVARRAVRSGFPRRPVYALTNAFRDAAYGGRPEHENADRAKSALDELDELDGADDENSDERATEGER